MVLYYNRTSIVCFAQMTLEMFALCKTWHYDHFNSFDNPKFILIHLIKNFKKRFRGFDQIYPAARAYREEIFYDNLAKMVSVSAAAVEWLRTNHKLLWYRCGFNPEIECDYITNNIAESFNNWIRDHKDLSVADLADKIREMIMVLWNKRRIIAYSLSEGRILPAIMVQLRANTRGLGHLKFVPCSYWSAEVWNHSGSVSEGRILPASQLATGGQRPAPPRAASMPRPCLFKAEGKMVT